MIGACVAVLLQVLSAPPAPAQPPPTPATPAERFLADLQRALARQDRRAVATLFEYPATVLASGFRMPVANAATLLQIFDVAFPPEMQGVISLSGIARAGQPAPIYKVTLNADGLSIGPGWVWARRIDGRFRITRVIVPGGWVSQGGSRPPPPERVLLRTGQTSALFSRTLAPYEIRSYVVWAAKGQQIQLRIDGYAGREILMRIVDPRTGAAPTEVDRQPVPGARVWSARVLESADYRIDVVRTSPQEKPPPMYVLSVTMR